MKSLALYVDKWYIVATVCEEDGVSHPVKLSNHEDRIWLYFFEDVVNDEVTYGKGNQLHYNNRENHYYGDVFSSVASSSATFTKFKMPMPMKKIFKSANIFDDLRAEFEEGVGIDTYLSFSRDIELSALAIFVEELQSENFVVKERVARIGHLALEYVAKHRGLSEDGIYLVLDACNENLHYALYQKSESLFIRNGEDILEGLGTDVRSRALIEHIVDSINTNEHFLQDKKEREFECYRMTQYVDNWLIKLSTARVAMPIQLTGITFSNDDYKEYSVRVQKSKIDERTRLLVENIVKTIVCFVKDRNVLPEQIKGFVFLGNTFSNEQFKKELCSHYNVNDDRIYYFKDVDLASLVSAYTFIDCNQFSEASEQMTQDAEAERKRKMNAEEEAEATRKAAEARRKQEEVNSAILAEEKRFKEAMENGYESEEKHDYDNMAEYFKIATELRPNDDEAKNKYDEALKLKARQSVIMDNYKQKIQQAKKAYEECDWEMAKQKAEEALSDIPDSNEALHIKDEANRHIRQEKELDRYLDRADLFMVQKAYNEALQELNKAKLIDPDNDEIQARVAKINSEKAAFDNKVNSLKEQLDESISLKNYDNAIEICNNLIELDFTESRKWSAKLSDIKVLQRKLNEDNDKWIVLVNGIESAQWNEDWATVVRLCQEALDIKNDNSIRTKLSMVQEKIKEEENLKKMDSTILEIKDLILSSDFSQAKFLLSNLRKMKLDDLHSLRVRELSSLLFKKEDEYEMAKLGQTQKQSQETTTISSPKPSPTGEDDSFFGSEVNGGNNLKKNHDASKSSNTQQGDSVRKKLTSDDFNF